MQLKNARKKHGIEFPSMKGVSIKKFEFGD